MANVSVNFNTATDNLDDVLATVEHIFGIAVNIAPAASNASPVVQNLASPATEAAPANFDASGLPWDGRIHAASKALTGKGIWRAKVGLDPQVKLAVENELRAANPNTAVLQPTPAPVAAAPVAAAPVAPAPVAPAPALPSIPNMPALPVMAETSFQKLSRFIAEQVQEGKLTNEWVGQALTAYQVPGGLLPNAAGMPEEAVAGILAGFKQALGIA